MRLELKYIIKTILVMSVTKINNLVCKKKQW